MPRLSENLLIFARILRRAGVAVHPARVSDLVEALGDVDLASRDEVYHASRALLVHRHDQIPTFNIAFAPFWREHGEGGAGPGPGFPPSGKAQGTGAAAEEALAPAGPGD